MSYVGRFAPSPTGALHFGSLVTAVASFCDARAVGGRWLIRIEDTDGPRNVAGAAAQIVTTLQVFGMQSDGPVLSQQQRLPLYDQAIEQLAAAGWVYGCACSRKHLPAPSHPHPCRDLGLPLRDHTVRLRVGEEPVCFVDRLQGLHCEQLSQSIGDVVLRRRDGIISYQLAVVVDDAAQGVTDVVRGADLLDNTARQLWLAQCLGLPAPRHLHVPLAMNAQGQKLSKQNLALPLPLDQPALLLRQALLALRQPDPGPGSVEQVLNHAVCHWQPALIGSGLALSGCYR